MKTTIETTEGKALVTFEGILQFLFSVMLMKIQWGFHQLPFANGLRKMLKSRMGPATTNQQAEKLVHLFLCTHSVILFTWMSL